MKMNKINELEDAIHQTQRLLDFLMNQLGEMVKQQPELATQVESIFEDVYGDESVSPQELAEYMGGESSSDPDVSEVNQ
jgi:hypothetical protein